MPFAAYLFAGDFNLGPREVSDLLNSAARDGNPVAQKFWEFLQPLKEKLELTVEMG